MLGCVNRKQLAISNDITRRGYDADFAISAAAAKLSSASMFMFVFPAQPKISLFARPGTTEKYKTNTESLRLSGDSVNNSNSSKVYKHDLYVVFYAGYFPQVHDAVGQNAEKFGAYSLLFFWVPILSA